MSRFVLTAQLQLQAPNNVAQVVRQIQSQLNNVSVNVQVQGAAQAQRQLQQVTTQTQAATTAADRMGRAFAISIRRFAAFSIATRAVSLFTSTLSDAVKTAIDFERELVKISQVTGQTMGQLKGLTREISSLATNFGVGSQSLLGVTRILSQAGFKADDLTIALRTLAKTELAPTFDNITQTAEGAIAIFNQFKLGAAALEAQLGAINAVAGQFAVEAGDLIDVVRRAGGVFKSAGGELNELIALFTSVRATTRESAESIGTGLRTIFTRIQRPKTIEFLKQFGVELVDLNGKFVGPFEAVKRLSSALAGLGEGDITFIRIAEELGGFRQIGKVLPLLQQFSTAQAALNVANKAGNSLTEDAAKAQLSLAIRITKVKEEFLALIRSVTETTTFQVMANTALSLASALIKIGEAIKPLLPLLAAVAAVKFARGISGFAAGIMGGMRSGRTYGTGGKVHHFARGGMVPGTGNRDTVPAMLQPGEFVIRKSSVNKLGASNLAAMNENRYNVGGMMTTAQKIAAARNQNLPSDPNKEKTKSYKSGSAKSNAVQFSVNPGSIGAFFMNPDGVPDKPVPFKDTPFILKNPRLKGLSGISGKKLGFGETEVSALLKSGTVSSFFPSLQDVSQGSFREIVQKTVKQKLSEAVMDSASVVEKQLGPPLNANKSALKTTASQRIQQDLGAIRTTSGYLFEGIIDALSGARPASNQSTFDFPASSLQGNRNRLSALFGPLGKLGQADAKASFSTDIIGGSKSGSLVNKIINSINNGVLGGIRMIPQKKNLGGIIEKFAAGGGVGTDTVPALLTPGEFVVNRSSAQRIGYGNLNRMNKVGKYAKGGVVQRFKKGGAVGDSAATTARTTDSIMASMTKKDVALVKMAMKNNSEVFDKVTKELQDMLYMEKEVTAGYKALARSLRAGDTAEKAYQQALEAAEASLTDSSKGKTTARNKPTEEGNIVDKMKGASKQEKLTTLLESKAQKGQLTAQDVGKGLGAGMSQAQAKAIAATNLQAQASQKAAQASQQSATADAAEAAQSNKAAAADAMESKASSQDFGNLAMGLSMVSGTIQAMLPPLDENSGLFLKMSHGLLGLITTITGIAFALSAFGITLNASTLASAASTAASFFMGTAGVTASAATLTLAGSATAAAAGTGGLAAATLTAASTILVAIAPLVGAVVTVLGPILAVVAAAWLLNKAFRAVIDMIWGNAKKMKEEAIAKGDVANAGRYAEIQTRRDNMSVGFGGGATAGAAAGAIIGSILPGVGTLIGAAVGGLIGGVTGLIASAFSGNSIEAARKYAEAQAGAVKLTKTLEATQKAGVAAMERFNKGLISSAELLNAFQPAFSETSAQNTRVLESVRQNSAARSTIGNGAILRNLGAYLGGGLFGMETVGTRNTRLEKESVDLIQGQTKAISETFSQSREARNASMRSALFRGEDPQKELKARGMDVGSMQKQMSNLRKAAAEADIAGNTKQAQELRKAAEVYEQEIKTTVQAMENLKKEVQIAKDKFAALNLGFRSITAAADASALRMEQAMSSFDLAAIPGVSAMQTLEAALTAAGQNISKADFDASLGQVTDILKKFGADAKQVTAFEDLTKGVATVQRDFPNIFDTLKDRLEGGAKDMSAENIGNEFKKIVGESLDKAGIGDAAKKRIIDSMGDVKIDGEDLAKLMAGDISVLEKYFGDAAEEISKNVKGFMDKWISVNQDLIKATQERIEAERNLVAAQKEAVDLYMEGRDVQAKYGGRSVSTEERRAAILAKANAGASGANIGVMRTGTAAELRQRQAQIVGGFGRIESMRGKDGSAMGAKGAELDATQQNLQQAQKDQVDTIRALIKLEEEELKIIQEKNKLEKDSLESLITGDVEKFFEQQAAMGAQASIAAGNKDAASLYGAKAVADAFKDIQRQQEAGVQTMFGRQLGGPGGLAEQAAGAALASRGVMDPRMAQRLAGTSPEEEAAKRRLQELGGLLGEAGAASANMAEMQVQTAQMKVEKAELIIANLETGGEPAQGRAMGGLIYANRGMFVPRGTDTVPAMLTPGEFVVRREAVNRGNNLQLLRAINSGGNASGMARGGKVGYYNNGGTVQYKALGDIIGNLGKSIGIDPQLITNLGNVFSTFISGFNESIKNLRDTKVQVKMDSVNVNVNLTGAGMLNQISDSAKKQVMSEVIQKLQNEYGIGPGGSIVPKAGSLATPGQGQ